jgi:hypothetical protein
VKDWPKTTEEQLAAIRKGRLLDLSLKMGDLEIPCRIMGAAEEAATIASARMRAKQATPDSGQSEVVVSMEVMKAILMKATNVRSVQHLTPAFLKELSSAELGSLYDQYVTLINTVNPEFEKLKPEQIADMIETVKKKEKGPRDFFTWELAAIGRCLLEEIQQQGSVPGH